MISPITQQLENNLRRMNPCWQHQPMRSIPPVKRWAFSPILKRLQTGLAKVTVLSGPRQVGKSTLVNQIIQTLLDEGVVATHILYVQFDELPELLKISEPILAIADWFERMILRQTFNEASKKKRPVYLFFDEIQNLNAWAPQLKFLADTSDVRVLVTDSSSLRIEQGRDSLAGRISTLEIGPLLLREIMEIRGDPPLQPFLPFNGLTPLKHKSFWQDLRQFGLVHHDLRDRAFSMFSERGAYPIAHARSDVPWEELAEALNETVIRRAIQHDLRIGARGSKRDEHLLEEVFRLACRYAGQSPHQPLYLDEIKRAMNANIGWQRILSYLKFLDGALLVRLIEPLELRLKRKRAASKLCICDHALRASWLHEVIPLDEAGLQQTPHVRDLAGHLAESVAGYFLRSITGAKLSHFPERGAEPEVDFVLTIGDQRIPIEVKYRSRVDYADTYGLRSFIEKSVYNAPFGILVTSHDEIQVDDPRIIALPLSTLLLMR